MKSNLLSLVFFCIGLFLFTNSTHAQQNVICNGVKYSLENGNVYQVDEQGVRLRIGYNVESIDCYQNMRILANLANGVTLGYDGRPNYWSSFEFSKNPCGEPLGTYYYDSPKPYLNVGDRIYTGKTLSSENGKYFALMTEDGRFTMNRVTKDAMCAGGIMLYLNYEEIWAAPMDRGTAGPGGYVEFQADGHLCMYTKDGGYRWCAPFSKGSVKVDISETTGCLQTWSNTQMTWNSCGN